MVLVSCIFGNCSGAVHTCRVFCILGGGCDSGILGTCAPGSDILGNIIVGLGE